MKFTFKNLYFNIENKKITLSLTENGVYAPFSEVQIAGENKDSHLGAKLIKTSQSAALEFVNKVQPKIISKSNNKATKST